MLKRMFPVKSCSNNMVYIPLQVQARLHEKEEEIEKMAEVNRNKLRQADELLKTTKYELNSALKVRNIAISSF